MGLPGNNLRKEKILVLEIKALGRDRLSLSAAKSDFILLSFTLRSFNCVPIMVTAQKPMPPKNLPIAAFEGGVCGSLFFRPSARSEVMTFQRREDDLEEKAIQFFEDSFLWHR